MEDREVIETIAAGDPAGLAAAYDKYAAGLYGYCRWMLRDPADAADTLRATFLIAATQLGTLRDPSQMRAWLYGVARDECYQRPRASRNGPDEPARADDAAPGADTAEPEKAEAQRQVLETLAGLKPGEREVIELSLRHQLDDAELGVVLGLPMIGAHDVATEARGHLEEALRAMVIARTGRTDPLGALRPEALTALLPRAAALPPGLREPTLRRPPPAADTILDMGRISARGRSGAASLLTWQGIRNNPGRATALGAVALWIAAAVGATLITVTGLHGVTAVTRDRANVSSTTSTSSTARTSPTASTAAAP